MATVENIQILEQIILTISPAALAAVRELLQEHKIPNYALRISAASSAHTGLQVGLSFEPQAQENDRVLEVEGIHVLLDSASLAYLNGLSIDYVQSPIGGTFQITQPKQASGCGCASDAQTVSQNHGTQVGSCCN